MPGYPLQSRAELRNSIRIAALSILESGELVTQRSLRRCGIRGTTSHVMEIKNDLIRNGDLPPQAGQYHRVSGDARFPRSVSDDELRSSVLQACKTLISAGKSCSVRRLRDAGARGGDDRIICMVRYLKESGIIGGDHNPRDLDAPLTFTQRMVQLYPGGKKRLRRDFSTRLGSSDSG